MLPHDTWPRTPPDSEPAHDSATLFMSLYLVLLAFFIMLNAVATLDKNKVYRIKDSVKDAFSLHQVLEDMPELFEDAGQDMTAAQFFSMLKKDVAASLIAAENMSIIQYGNIMELQLPLDSVFKPNSTLLYEVTTPLFDTIASQVSHWSGTLYIEMEFLVSTPHEPPALIEDHSSRLLSIERANRLSQYFLAKNMRAKQMVPGIRYDDTPYISLLFHVRDSQKSSVTLSPNQGALHGR